VKIRFIRGISLSKDLYIGMSFRSKLTDLRGKAPLLAEDQCIFVSTPKDFRDLEALIERFKIYIGNVTKLTKSMSTKSRIFAFL